MPKLSLKKEVVSVIARAFSEKKCNRYAGRTVTVLVNGCVNEILDFYTQSS